MKKIEAKNERVKSIAEKRLQDSASMLADHETQRVAVANAAAEAKRVANAVAESKRVADEKAAAEAKRVASVPAAAQRKVDLIDQLRSMKRDRLLELVQANLNNDFINVKPSYGTICLPCAYFLCSNQQRGLRYATTLLRFLVDSP